MPTAAVKRFHATLDKSSDCWLWMGFRVAAGYGRYYSEGKVWRAHRYAYEKLVGPIGDLCVLHKCDNPPCCNPAHLFLGTPRDNARDRSDKGRSGKEKRSGEAATGSKLTWDDVRIIRQSSGSLSEIAAQFGVTKQNIAMIRKNKTWVLP